MRRLFFASIAVLTSGCAGLLGLDDFTEGESSGAGAGSSTTEGAGNPTSTSQGGGSSSTGTSGDGGASTGTGVGGAGGGGALEVTPDGEQKVGILRSLQLTANQPVTWAVVEPEGGTIDDEGLYLSPDAPGSFHIVATSVDDPASEVSVAAEVVPLGVSIFAGIPGGPGTLDGPASRARLVDVGGMAIVGNNGNLVFSDASANTIRIFDRNQGDVSTLAGAPFEVGAVDGPGVDARFDQPGAVVAAATGSRFFVADEGNFCIRDINAATGVVATLSGACGVSGTTDGANGAASRFETITQMARSSDGAHLYLCQVGSNRSLRRVEIATGKTETILSALNTCSVGVDLFNQHVYFTNGQDGMLKRFNDAAVINLGTVVDVAPLPQSSFFARHIAVDTGFGGERSVYVEVDGAIWRFDIQAGVFDAAPYLGAEPGYVDGPLADARVANLGLFITHPPQGRIYFADRAASTIREIDVDAATVDTVVGVRGNIVPVDGAKAEARLISPFGAALDEAGDAYVISLGEDADNTIRHVDAATGAIDTFSGVRGFTGDILDGARDEAKFGLLFDIVRVEDKLYVLDGFASTLRSVDLADGSVATVAGRTLEPGFNDGFGVDAQFDFEGGAGLATDGVDVYIAEGNNHRLRKVDLSTGEVTTIAGGADSGSIDGDAATARFVTPVGLTFDRGSLYVVDFLDHTLRQMDLSTGDVTTLLGISGISGNDDGGVGVATFSSPFRIAADGIGNLYVTGVAEGLGGGTIRRVAIESREALPFAGDLTRRGLATGALPSTLGCAGGLIVDAKGDLLFADRCDGAVGAIRPL